MTILPIDPIANATPAALLAFLEQCRAMAAEITRPRLVSITLEVPALDPLAVLESIFEPNERHFYVERPAENFALAGAEAVLGFSAHGPARFAECQRFIDATLADAIAVGDQTAAFAGPHFFTAYSFFDDTEPGEPFESASIFIPRWQVALANGRTTAVANFIITPDADLPALAQKVWHAHQKVARAASPCLETTLQTHGLAARATQTQPPRSPTWDPNFTASLHIRQGAYLPHWTRDGAIYAITFRLADSLPQPVLQSWIAEREDIIATARQFKRPLSEYELERLNKLHSEKIEAYLDSGAGECHLRQDEIAGSLRETFQHFDGQRYRLHTWCVMPNHVHVIVQPLPGYDLKKIVHTWKSYTANKANRLIGRDGAFWQPEYYDRLIRNETEYQRTTQYVHDNPTKAGLGNWKWIGSGTGCQPVSENSSQTHGLAARATATADYPAAVTRALELIARGEFHKIVLARALDFTTPDAAPLHPLRILNTLRQRFADCYSFSLANGLGQSFIGASPERLLRVNNRRLLTEALAGSAPRGASASEDAALGSALLRNEKDLREQRHVLDSILRRLEPLGLKSAYPEQPGLRKLANVQHLHTPVEAALPADDSVRLLDALARLHPTPAVGGTPREAAIAHIRELENFPRGLYAGAIGWIDARGNGDFFVGLRSALIDGPRARLYAGAGIVAGSSPEREYDETEIKFRAIRDALAG